MGPSSGASTQVTAQQCLNSQGWWPGIHHIILGASKAVCNAMLLCWTELSPQSYLPLVLYDCNLG